MKYFIAMVFALVQISASATLITYTIEGDLSDSYGGPDVNDLSRAHFVWVTQFVSTAAPIIIDNQAAWTRATYQAISSTINITNRHSGSPDVQREVISYAGPGAPQFLTKNGFGASTEDTFRTDRSGFTINDFHHVEINAFLVDLPVDFYPGSEAGPLPPDLSETINQDFLYWISPNHGTRYLPENFSITVSVSAGTIYTFSTSGSNVVGFDANTGTYLGALGQGVNAIAYGDGVIYTFSTSGSNVVGFDANTGAYLGALGQGINAIAYGDGVIYTFSTSGSNVVGFDPNTGAYLGEFGQGVNAIAYGDGVIYTFSGSGSNVVGFDATTGAYLGEFGQGVNAIAYGEGVIYTFSGSGSNVVGFDATTGAYLGEFGQGVNAIAYGDGVIYTFSGSGSNVVGFDANTGAYLGEFGQGVNAIAFAGAPQPNIAENTGGVGLDLGSALFTQTIMGDITITNYGNADLVVTDISVTGADANAFSSTGDCIGSVARLATCTIIITFTASAPEGIKVAEVTVNSNDPDTPNLLISLMAESVESPTDSDGDGVIDPEDNCQLTDNPSQRDTDNDGYGNRCDADFDQNCVVNFIDLNIIAAFFLVPGDFDTDLNGDGVTNFLDFSIFASNFLQPPGPSGVTSDCDGA